MSTNPKKASNTKSKGKAEYVTYLGVKVPKNPPKDPKERAKYEKLMAEAQKRTPLD